MNAPHSRKRRRLTERRLERKLVNLFDNLFSRRSGGWAENFEDAGVLTGNRGWSSRSATARSSNSPSWKANAGKAETPAWA